MTAKSKVPPGYKDEAEFLEEARERFQQAIDFDRENRDAAVEDLQFLAGDQWDKDALTQRAGLPCLVINTLPQFVAQVVGDIRINRPSIRVRPAEDADKDLAEIREGLIRAIERDNDAQGVYAETGQNQVACGIGNFRVGLKYASDTGFERDISISSIPNPVAVVWDPLSTERTGRDAQWCFVVDEMPRKAFKARWGEPEESDLTVPQTDEQGWYTTDTVRVTEYWLVKETPVELLLVQGQDGSTSVVEKEKLPPGVQVLDRRQSVRKSACMYLITGQKVLDGPYELPVDRVPIFRARGWEINVGTKRVRFGLVRFAKDSQRLKNFWRSVSAQYLALAPQARWLLHESQEGEADAFREAHANGDPVLTWSGGQKPEFIPPPQMNAAVLQEATLNQQDIKDVTGIHEASLGARSNETSGKAILARQREGDVASYVYHDNLRAAIQEAGRVVEALIPVAYDTARTIRVVGEDDAVKVQRLNDPNDPKSVDINRGKYDVVVEVGPSYSTKRVEAAESMAQFFQVVPAAAQAAGDLFAKAQDWPMADAIGERLKRTLPPQLVEEPDEELTPEQMQERQAQMQAAQEGQMLQRQAAMLQLAEQDAKVKLTQAQAVKLLSEADAPSGPQETELDVALKLAQIRKAQAEADRAEVEVMKARAEAERAVIGVASDEIAVQSDAMDLQNKPAEQALGQAQAVKALKEPPKAAGGKK